MARRRCRRARRRVRCRMVLVARPRCCCQHRHNRHRNGALRRSSCGGWTGTRHHAADTSAPSRPPHADGRGEYRAPRAVAQRRRRHTGCSPPRARRRPGHHHRHHRASANLGGRRGGHRHRRHSPWRHAGRSRGDRGRRACRHHRGRSGGGDAARHRSGRRRGLPGRTACARERAIRGLDLNRQSNRAPGLRRRCVDWQAARPAGSSCSRDATP